MNRPTCATCPWFQVTKGAENEDPQEGRCRVTPAREQRHPTREGYRYIAIEGDRIGCRHHPDWERFFKIKKFNEDCEDHIAVCRAMRDDDEDLTPDA